MKDWLKEIVLEGDNIQLVPLSLEYRDKLVAAASDGELWNLWFTGVPSETSIDQYIGLALEDKKKGTSLPFVVIDKKLNQVIGSTRFCHSTPSHRRTEIGFTWYAKRTQRTSVNTECKLLLLTYAFESLKAVAVEFRTHCHNQKSRTAITRLGAKQDGILRNHMIDNDGDFRDTVVFSIIESEWKTVKKSLQHKLTVF